MIRDDNTGKTQNFAKQAKGQRGGGAVRMGQNKLPGEPHLRTNSSTAASRYIQQPSLGILNSNGAHLRMKSFASADTAGLEGNATSRAFSMTCG
jgi:hypothetical protein